MARSIAPLTHSLAPRCHARRPDQHDGAGGATRRGQHADHMGAEPGYGEDEDGGAGDPEEAELQAPGEEEALPQGRGQGDRAAEAPRGVSLKLAKAGRIVRADLRRPRVTGWGGRARLPHPGAPCGGARARAWRGQRRPDITFPTFYHPPQLA